MWLFLVTASFVKPKNLAFTKEVMLCLRTALTQVNNKNLQLLLLRARTRVNILLSGLTAKSHPLQKLKTNGRDRRGEGGQHFLDDQTLSAPCDNPQMDHGWTSKSNPSCRENVADSNVFVLIFVSKTVGHCLDFVYRALHQSDWHW